MPKTPIHKSVTESRILELVKLYNTTTQNPGVCLACGEDAEGCEPDARRYPCDNCGRRLVFGAYELLLSGYYHKR